MIAIREAGARPHAAHQFLTVSHYLDMLDFDILGG
jgi:hypothetical protein